MVPESLRDFSGTDRFRPGLPSALLREGFVQQMSLSPRAVSIPF